MTLEERARLVAEIKADFSRQRRSQNFVDLGRPLKGPLVPGPDMRRQNKYDRMYVSLRRLRQRARRRN